MAFNILVDGDEAMFGAAVGPATVVARSGKLASTENVKIGGKAVCVLGDENQVLVSGINYSQGGFAGGNGMLQVNKFLPQQHGVTVKVGGKPVLLQGNQFIAKFTPQAKAMQPAGPSMIPDPLPQYVGPAPVFGKNTLVTGA